jgi:hypothetical protein
MDIPTRQVDETAELLRELSEDVRGVPWVVVVDGIPDSFAEKVSQEVKEVHPSSRFWLVGWGDTLGTAILPADSPLRINLDDTDDVRFLKNLFADLVVIPAEPEPSRRERMERWITRARYILAERLEEPLVQELRSAVRVGDRIARIYVTSDVE